MKLCCLYAFLVLFSLAGHAQGLITKAKAGETQLLDHQPNLIARSILKNEKRINKSLDLFRIISTKNSSPIVSLSINDQARKLLLSAGQEPFEVKIPVDNQHAVTLQLQRTELFEDDFHILLASGKKVEITPHQLHSFHGIIKGDPASMVSLTSWDDDMDLFIADHDGSYTLHPTGVLSKYEFYQEHKSQDRVASCAVDEHLRLRHDNTPIIQKEAKPGQRNKRAGDIVEIYIEVDHALYNQKGGTSGVMSYLSSLIGITAILYANEGITVQMVSPKFWNITDPYAGITDIPLNLNTFGSTLRDNYSGRLASLISGKRLSGNSVGGIAWVDVLCFANQGVWGPYSFMYGAGQYGFNPFPQRSLDAQVFAHELGHNFGSYHTHDCMWGSNSNLAIDKCVNHNNCGLVANPVPAAALGTIMSYCGNVDFIKGFGTEPGALIYSRYVNATCLTSAAPPCDGTNQSLTDMSITNGMILRDGGQLTLGGIESFSGANPIMLFAESSFQVTGTLDVVVGTPMEILIAECN